MNVYSKQTWFWHEDMKEEINNLEISLRADIIPIDGPHVRLTLYVENTTDDEEIGFSLGIDCIHVILGVVDQCKVQSTGDGILMLGRNFKTTDIRIMSMPLLSKTMMRY